MKKTSCAACCLLLALLAVCAPPARAGSVITMSTTTSTVASGLLDVLLPAFTRDTGIRVKVVAKGTGAAIRDGMDGNVDVIFVHAREREEAFVRQGYGTKRYGVMHNDFVIAGPKSDPAGIAGMEDAAAAFRRIAAVGALFVSRGDDSGTHTKEQFLWRQTGLALTGPEDKRGHGETVRGDGIVRPAGAWYLSIGQGMGKALRFADEKQAYVLTDRGTFLKYTLGGDLPISLVVLVEGDPRLANPYGLIPVNPKRFPHVRYQEARRLAEWLVSPRGQERIASYRLLGRRLFFPDAGGGR